MILDHLISKYLDGELSSEEDSELRRLIAADPLAKEAFDAAVLVHIAMRCEDDANADTPDDVAADVYDNVLAHIDDDEDRRTALPVAIDPVARASRRRVLSLVAAVLMLVVPVGHDWFMTGGDQAVILPELPTLDAIDDGGRHTTTVFRSRRVHTTTDVRNDESTDDAFVMSVVSDDFDTDGDAAERSMAETHADDAGRTIPLSVWFGGRTPDVSAADHDDASIVDPRAAGSTCSPARVAVVEADYPMEVLLATLYTQGMTTSLPSTSNVRSISQSLGYAVAPSSVFGLEVGSTSYDVERSHEGSVRVGGAPEGPARAAAPPREDGGIMKLLPGDSPVGTYFRQTSVSMNSEQMVWGAAFLQQSIMNAGGLAVQGRAALGAGEDGMLAYGRIQGEYKLYRSVSLTVGAEARYVPFRTNAIGGVSTSSSYGAIYSLLYGVQIRL